MSKYPAKSTQSKSPPAKLKPIKFFPSIPLIVLSIIILLIIFSGDSTPVAVTSFSWQGKKIGVNDGFFSLTFSKVISPVVVEENLKITPSLDGKFSWYGNKLFYTLTETPVYGSSYYLTLQDSINNSFESYAVGFQTHDRAYVYIGIEGDEEGRLILYNFTTRNKTILTPKDLIVTDFKIYPDGEKILFSAYDPTKSNQELTQQLLYTVTTGLNFQTSSPQAFGIIDGILLDKNYQNLQFDLANDGTIVAQRINLFNPSDSSLWIISNDGKSRPLGFPSNEFAISSNGRTLAFVKNNGVVLFPLKDTEESEFYPDFQKIIAFSPDNFSLLMVKSQSNGQESLFLVNSNGESKELFTSISPINDCVFNPKEPQIIYCLQTEVIQTGNFFREEPFLKEINTQTGSDIKLLVLPIHRDINLSVAPDGMALLFDRVINPPSQRNFSRNRQKRNRGFAHVWVLPLSKIDSDNSSTRITLPEEVLPGFKPQWIP